MICATDVDEIHELNLFTGIIRLHWEQPLLWSCLLQMVLTPTPWTVGKRQK
jgi:hypothetical protein